MPRSKQPTPEIQSATSDIDTGSQTVSQSMSSLLELSNSTVGGIKEVTIGINEINRAMTDLKEITLESKASTENVQEEIKHFKI